MTVLRRLGRALRSPVAIVGLAMGLAVLLRLPFLHRGVKRSCRGWVRRVLTEVTRWLRRLRSNRHETAASGQLTLVS